MADSTDDTVRMFLADDSLRSAFEGVLREILKPIVEEMVNAEWEGLQWLQRERCIAIVEDELKYEYHPIVRKIVERIRSGE